MSVCDDFGTCMKISKSEDREYIEKLVRISE